MIVEKSIKMPKYESCKDSEVSWLGMIPLHWETEKSQWLFRLRREKARRGDEQLTASQKYGMISQKKFMEIEGRRVTQVEFNPEILKHVEADDFVISMRSFQGGIEYCHEPGSVSSAYVPLIPHKHVHSPYFKYLLKSQRYIEALQSTSNLVRDGQALRYENFRMVDLPVVPEQEQALIASFLDKKTTQIDEAIAIKEQQIALLKERKQIIIQKAITQGLDPNVPMKDSGVDWIGKIPAHWGMKRLKYVTKIVKRIIGYEGPDVLSITQKGIKIKDIESGEGQLAMDYSKYQIVEIGDFAMNHMDLLTGYVDISKYPGVVSPDYRVFIRTFDGLVDEFLLSIFQLGYQQKIFFRYGQGVSLLGRWRFPAENFNNFFVPIPPKDEQVSIVKQVNKEWDKVDSGIEILLSQIEKLKEYKATLINSAVTGKIKVTPEMAGLECNSQDGVEA